MNLSEPERAQIEAKIGETVPPVEGEELAKLNESRAQALKQYESTIAALSGYKKRAYARRSAWL